MTKVFIYIISCGSTLKTHKRKFRKKLYERKVKSNVLFFSQIVFIDRWAKPRAEAQTARDLNKSPRYYGPQSINTQWAKAQEIQDGHTVQTTRNRVDRPRRAARRRHYRRGSEPAEPPHVHKRSSPNCLHAGGFIR